LSNKYAYPLWIFDYGYERFLASSPRKQFKI